jgi:hypothetical protein
MPERQPEPEVEPDEADDTIPVTIHLPRKLHNQAKAACAMAGDTLKHGIIAAIRVAFGGFEVREAKR